MSEQKGGQHSQHANNGKDATAPVGPMIVINFLSFAAFGIDKALPEQGLRRIS